MLLKYILSNKYKVKDIKVILGCEDTSRHKVIKYLMCCWVSKNTELGFVSFSSGQFNRMAVVNPLDKKQVNSTFVHCIWWDTLDMYVKAVAPYSRSNIACLVLGIDRLT